MVGGHEVEDPGGQGRVAGAEDVGGNRGMGRPQHGGGAPVVARLEELLALRDGASGEIAPQVCRADGLDGFPQAFGGGGQALVDDREVRNWNGGSNDFLGRGSRHSGLLTVLGSGEPRRVTTKE